jgi:hypothetical protein
LLEQGALAQMTASSLPGMHDKATTRCAEVLLKKGLIHCIASNADGLHKRLPDVAVGLQTATLLLGHEKVYQMVEVWPMAILHNEVLHPSDPCPQSRGRATRERDHSWLSSSPSRRGTHAFLAQSLTPSPCALGKEGGAVSGFPASGLCSTHLRQSRGFRISC